MVLSVQDLQEKIISFQRPEIETISIDYNELNIVVNKQSIKDFLTFLRDEPELRFIQLIDLCGVDYPSRPDRFEIVYHLLSLHENCRIRVKLSTHEDAPVLSVMDIFPTADWLEREAFDMFGIIFTGHNDMRRILTDYGFSGYPLRKDFPVTGFVELRYDEGKKRVTYDKVSLTQDYRSFDFMSPWEGAKYTLSQKGEA